MPLKHDGNSTCDKKLKDVMIKFDTRWDLTSAPYDVNIAFSRFAAIAAYFFFRLSVPS